jgi:hypothetical protein
MKRSFFHRLGRPKNRQNTLKSRPIKSFGQFDFELVSQHELLQINLRFTETKR